MSNFAEWLNSVTVLYVGDGKSTQAGWLESAGAQVLTAASAEEARSACEKDPTAIDAAVVEADYSGAGWLGVARDLPGSCALLVIAHDVEPSLLETIVTVRGDVLSKAATQADFLFRVKNITKLSVPSMRRLAANATKLWSLPRQLSRLLYYNLWSYSDQEIADAMGLSRHTIQEYQDELRRRTGVRTKHAYLRRLLEYAGEEPPLSMSDNTRAHVTQFRRRSEGTDQI